MALSPAALRGLVVERLVAAADEIFALFERTFAEYEHQLLRTKQLQHREDYNTTDYNNPAPQNGHFLFPSAVVKIEDVNSSSSFPQNSVSLVKAEEEPGCSSDLPPDPQDTPYSCSEPQDTQPYSCSDQSEEEQGAQDEPAATDGDIPALYKSLFFPEAGASASAPEPTNQSAACAQRRAPHGPLRCPICSKSCRNNSGLMKHMGVHTEERPFRCSVCMKGFNQKCNLKRHMATHSQEKSFSCPECGLRLKQQHNLLRHISAVHRGVRPYSCPLCDKAFAQKTVFIIHMRTHTGEKPFSCSVCRKRFRDKCHLKRHVKTHGQLEVRDDARHSV
ncbi:unnamed protein product [Knipowitschia caucasica]